MIVVGNRTLAPMQWEKLLTTELLKILCSIAECMIYKYFIYIHIFFFFKFWAPQKGGALGTGPGRPGPGPALVSTRQSYIDIMKGGSFLSL